MFIHYQLLRGWTQTIFDQLVHFFVVRECFVSLHSWSKLSVIPRLGCDFGLKLQSYNFWFLGICTWFLGPTLICPPLNSKKKVNHTWVRSEENHCIWCKDDFIAEDNDFLSNENSPLPLQVILHVPFHFNICLHSLHLWNLYLVLGTSLNLSTPWTQQKRLNHKLFNRD